MSFKLFKKNNALWFTSMMLLGGVSSATAAQETKVGYPAYPDALESKTAPYRASHWPTVTSEAIYGWQHPAMITSIASKQKLIRIVLNYDTQAVNQKVAGVVPMMMLQSKHFYGGVGLSFHTRDHIHTDDEGNSCGYEDRYFITVALGLRNWISEQAALTAGVKGDVTLQHAGEGQPEDGDGYDVAAYVGFDYAFDAHWGLTSKLYAVNWGRQAGQTPDSSIHHLSAFGGGSMGISYQF